MYGKLYRSQNNGVSWQQIANSTQNLNPHFVKIDSRGYIYVANATYSMDNLNNCTLWRSVDSGDNWDLVMDGGAYSPWKMTEMANGTLMFNTYTYVGDEIVYRSTDDGASWFNWQDWGNNTMNHIHSVRANPYNDDVWIVSGDTYNGLLSYIKRLNAETNTWENITTGGLASQIIWTDLMFDSKYAYIAPDGASLKINRVPHRGTWAEKTDVFDLYNDESSNAGGATYSMTVTNYGDFMVVPTDLSTVEASTDGEHWAKILETPGNNTGGIAWRFISLTSRLPVYVVNFKYGLLYRIDITAADIQRIIGSYYNEYFGTYSVGSLRIPVQNGTHIYQNITSYSPSRIRVSVMGMEQGNYGLNNGFETGTLANWTVIQTTAQYSISTADKQSGTYSLRINKSNTDSNDFIIENNASMNLYEYGENVFYGVYSRANRTGLTNKLVYKLGYYDSSDVWTVLSTLSVTPSTSWTNWGLSTAYTSATPQKNLKFRIYCIPSATYNYRIYLDSMTLEKKANTRVIRKVANGDTIVYKIPDAPTRSSYYTTVLKSVNINLTITGFPEAQNITYIGTLEDGETKDFFFTLATSLDLFITVAESKQVILIITWAPPENVFTVSDYAFGVIIVGASTTALAWYWRRKTKTRTVSVPP